jgi:hypothetical protein
MNRRPLSDSHDTGRSLGMRFARGCAGLAQRPTQEMLARDGLYRDKRPRIRFFKGHPQLLFVNPLGLLCNLVGFIGRHSVLLNVPSPDSSCQDNRPVVSPFTS